MKTPSFGTKDTDDLEYCGANVKQGGGTIRLDFPVYATKIKPITVHHNAVEDKLLYATQVRHLRGLTGALQLTGHSSDGAPPVRDT